LSQIDAVSEARRAQEAIACIERTRERFAGTPTEAAAVFARLRLDVAISDWQHASESADELLQKPLPTGSNTTANEVIYLKAHALERAGRLDDAMRTYLLIPDGASSYYGGLATDRLRQMSD